MIKLQSWFHRYNAWSFTKHGMWKECKRKYYYHYIGTALQSSPDFSVYKLKQLKDLNSKSVLQGKLIHEVIEDQMDLFRSAHRMQEESARDKYVQQVERYRKGAKQSLTEYFNGQTVHEAFFDMIRENGLDQLSLFYGVIWPELESTEYLRHEQFDHFKVSEQVTAIVKVDYASRTESGVVIISDWKTGVDNPEYESDLQIGAYVLWAMQYYDLRPQQVKSQLVYLSTGNVRPYEFSLEQLLEIKNLIIADFKKMNASYDISYFEPSPEPHKCLSCNFASICPTSAANIQSSE